MKPQNFLLVLLVLAAVLADLAIATRLDTAIDTALMLFLGLAFGQLALLAFWCVSGQKNWWSIRLGAAILFGAVLAKPIAWSTAAPWAQWLAVVYFYTLIVGLLTWATYRQNEVNRSSPVAILSWLPGVRSIPIQFSLRGLFAMTATIAMCLGTARHITVPWHAAWTLIGYSTCLALVAVSAFWAAVSHYRLQARVLPLAIVCLVGGWLMNKTEDAASAWYFTCVAMTVAATIWLGIATIHQSRKSFLASRSGT